MATINIKSIKAGTNGGITLTDSSTTVTVDLTAAGGTNKVLASNGGTTWGVYNYISLSTSDTSNSAVYGQTTANRTLGSYSELNGLGGYFTSSGTNGMGCWGASTSTTGVGVFGYNNQTTGGTGVYGQGTFGIVGYANNLTTGADISCSRNNRILFAASITGNGPSTGAPCLFVEGTNLKFWNGTATTTLV